MEEETHRRDAEDEWSQLSHELVVHSRAIRMYSAREARRMEMRGRFSVLHALYHAPEGSTPGELAEKCRVSTARIAQMLNALERDGLIVRTPSETDRRRVVVRLTDAGEQELRKYFDSMNAHIVSMLKQLGPDDAHELVRIAGRMAQILKRCEDERGADATDGGDVQCGC